MDAAALIPRRGRFLIVQRADALWGLPGGAVESGEDAGQAIERVLCDSLGVTGHVYARLYEGDGLEVVAALITSEIDPGISTTFAWVKREALPSYSYAPAIVAFIELVAAGEVGI